MHNIGLIDNNQSPIQALNEDKKAVKSDFSDLILQEDHCFYKASRTYRIQPNIPSAFSEIDDQLILSMLDHLKSTPEGIHPIIDYVNKLTCHTKRELQLAKYEQVKKGIIEQYLDEIGSIIYLADQNPAATENLLNPKNFRKSRQNVQKEIERNFNEISHQLQKFHTLQEQSLFPNALNSLAIKMAATMASLLITQDSYFNAMLIPKMIKCFIPQEFIDTSNGQQDNRPPFKIRMQDVLLTLMDAAYNPQGPLLDLQKRFKEIQLPNQKNSDAYFRSTLMIKAALGLNNTVTLTQRDAAVAILFSLFGWNRQTENGACFAEWLQIQLLSKRLDIALSDAESLVTNGSLFRDVNGKILSFEFTSTLPNSANSMPIGIDQTGRISDAKAGYSWYSIFHLPFIKQTETVLFWEAPAYQAAIKMWGIPNENLGAFYQEVLNHLLNKSSATQITMTKLITISAEIWSKKQSLSPKKEGQLFQELLITGNYASEALDCNPIQRAWINAAATFHDASNLKNRYFSDIIKDCTLKAINQLNHHLDQASDEYKKIENQFGIHLLEMTQLQFKMEPLEARQDKKFGFFILHKKDALDQFKGSFLGKTIDSGKKFKKMAKEALNIFTIENSKKLKQKNANVLIAFEEAIKNNEFIPIVEKQFQTKLDSALDKKMTLSPWKFWDGGLPAQTYAVCMNARLDLDNFSIVTPKEVIDLANWYLTGLYNYCQKTSDWDFEFSPPYMCGSIKGHVFNWIIGQPSIIPILDYMKVNQCDAEAAFNAQLLPSAKKTSTVSLPIEAIQKILKSLKFVIKEKMQKNELTEKETAELAIKLDLLENEFVKKSLITIGEMSDKILNLIKETLSDQKDRKLLASELTNLVLSNIDNKDFEEFIAPALLIADSNWEDMSGIEPKKVYFFISISPVTLEPFLGEINEEKNRSNCFNLLPNLSKYYAMHHFEVKNFQNPSILKPNIEVS
jgi:hypothetical protein